MEKYITYDCYYFEKKKLCAKFSTTFYVNKSSKLWERCLLKLFQCTEEQLVNYGR